MKMEIAMEMRNVWCLIKLSAIVISVIGIVIYLMWQDKKSALKRRGW